MADVRRTSGPSLQSEQRLWTGGCGRVAGVDEVGAGCLAGPVMAAAVILPQGWTHPGVKDSKKLSPAQREKLAPIIREAALSHAIGVAEVEEIDRLNILNARLLAMRRAVENLRPAAEHVLVDGNKTLPGVACAQTAIVGGDAGSLTIAAASILAKVARDALMDELAANHPGYGFEKHKGYPSPEHKAALEQLGVCPHHRRTFAPVAELLRRRFSATG